MKNKLAMFLITISISAVAENSDSNNVKLTDKPSLMDQIFGGTGVAVQIGTLGTGINLSKSIYKDYLALRLNFNYLGYSPQIDNNTYNLKLQSYGILLDYQPFANNFRISSGLYINNNSLNIINNGTINLNGISYNSSQYANLSGGVEYNMMSPYIGIGYGKNATTIDNKKGLYLLADAGVIIANPTINLNATCTQSSSTLCQEFYENLNIANQSLKDTVNAYGMLYPVISIGLGYRF